MDDDERIERAIAEVFGSVTSCEFCPLHGEAGAAPRINQRRIQAIVDELIAVIYPGCHGCAGTAGGPDRQSLLANLHHAISALRSEMEEAFAHHDREVDPRAETDRVTLEFLSAIPEIRHLLEQDILAAFAVDPAARSTMEVVLAYPGVLAVTVHRIAHQLRRSGLPYIPRVMSEHAHSLTGIDIHPGAAIDEGFFIDHGTGVVIGETTTIGKRVTLYQGVTLGGLSFLRDETGVAIKGRKRHPDVEDDVVIYAGATILGGETRIGAGSVIGGNVWLTHSVPPGSRVYNNQPRPEIRAGDDPVAGRPPER